MNTVFKSHKKWFVTGGVILLVLLVAGAVFFSRKPSDSPPTLGVGTAQEPTLIHGNTIGQESLTQGKRNDLKKKIADIIAAHTKDGSLKKGGVWFRDLNNGPSLGVNSTAEFMPASLLKLPLAIWFYHEASTSPDILTQEIAFTGPKGVSIEHFPAPESVTPGNTYTVEKLIELMLEDSDNDATAILGQIAGTGKTASVYKDIGVRSVENYQTYTINVNDYASFLRILYNATYLTPAYSNHVLAVLSKSTFNQGLVAGVPSGVTVAHKFGERTLDPSGSVNQLNDCGIIYVPDKPYILCVMVQGRDYDGLAGIIAEISRATYEAVTAP